MKITLLIFFIFLFCLNLNAQKALFFASEPNSEEQNIFVKNNYINEIIIIYQQHIVTNDEFDEKKFRKKISEIINNKFFDGFVVLNWEGKGYSALVNNQVDNPKRFKKYLQQFIQSVEVLKEMRPMCKVSYYDFPQRRVNKRTKAQWYKFADGLMPLFNKLDFLCPSLYSNILEYKENGNNLNNIEVNLSFALEYGKKLDKPVYPFVWHRINPSQGKYRYAIIPKRQFKKEISYILNYSVQNTSVAGIVWWQSEQYDIDKLIRNRQLNSQKRYFIHDNNRRQSEFFQEYYNSIKYLFYNY